MGLKNIVIGGLLFASGCLMGNKIQHAAANFVADEDVPLVRVAYTKRGTFVNDQKVYGERIGEARCDWQELAPNIKATYALSELAQNKSVVLDYLRNTSEENQRHFAYNSLVQLASKNATSVEQEVGAMRDAIGFRWDFEYTRR